VNYVKKVPSLYEGKNTNDIEFDVDIIRKYIKVNNQIYQKECLSSH